MTPEEKVVQALAEAHGLESAMLQTLAAHTAVTPGSEYRELLARHTDETRARIDRLADRLEELGESRGPLQVAYGLAQTAISSSSPPAGSRSSSSGAPAARSGC